MKSLGVVLAAAVLSLATLAGSCGGDNGWVTMLEDGQAIGGSETYSRKSAPFELSGAAWRLRYETAIPDTIRVSLVPVDDPANRRVLLEEPYDQEGETTIPSGPGYYYLDIEGVNTNSHWSLWVEEKRD